MFLAGPIFGLAAGIVLVFVRAEWAALEEADPRRRLALHAAGVLAQDWARLRQGLNRWTDTVSVGAAKSEAAK